MENIISTFYIAPSKKLIKSGVLFFVFLTATYLLLLGTVLDNIAKKKELNGILESESQSLYELQSDTEEKNKNLTLNFFLKLGYAESQKSEVIKTVRNVASLNAPHY